MEIGLITGGPSLERGVALNSARCVLDHLDGNGIDLIPFYLDYRKVPWQISKSQLYSNTPSDFDFKLRQTAEKLRDRDFIAMLKEVDIAFPVMHGQFGEDGGIQKLLEENGIPFVGTSSEVCRKVFDKFTSNELIRSLGFTTLPTAVLKIYHTDHEKIIKKFFKEHSLTRAIVKPAAGGSSIGVFSVSTPAEAMEKVRLLFSKRMDTRVVLQPFAEGTEFTAVILESRFGLPVCILPTEERIDYTHHQIFDFRKKYLPTNRVKYYCPPTFSNDMIERIQVQAEQLFTAFGMHDVARFDGWVLSDGRIWFSDFNPVTGMEQNSFLFQQASRIGMSHRDVLRHIVRTAARRQGVRFPKEKRGTHRRKRSVRVLFGGATSERQVSLMSGTNAWLKLKGSEKYDPEPYLLDTEGRVWHLPYAFALNHTVEDIMESCRNAEAANERLSFLVEKVALRLASQDGERNAPFFLPGQMNMADFIRESEFIFIGLHGGDGENGVLQKKLEDCGKLFNGPCSDISRLCADKFLTSRKVLELGIPGLFAIPELEYGVEALASKNWKELAETWDKTRESLETKVVLVKPRADGCSTGIVALQDAEEFKRYIGIISGHQKFIPRGTFSRQSNVIEMPSEPPRSILLQKFIETDVLRVKGNQLKYYRKSGWIEVTAGVLRQGKTLRVFKPSITVAEGDVLSVEEKFQGGTGINITPPPENLVSGNSVQRSRKIIGALCEAIGLTGYSRIDAFMNVDDGNLILIEINTLPGLTGSTVLFHQALAERPAVYPRELLEELIRNKGY